MSPTDPQADTTHPGRFRRWLEDRTGLPGALRACPVRESAGRPAWWSLWISLVLWAAVIQAVTGWFLWMYYSPSAQTAWESVYYIQYEVLGGWLLRGLHYWTAQVLVALLLLYLAQMIVRGVYRAPREFVFWTALFLVAFALGLCLTGDLLSWDQNAYASTKTRVSFLALLPWIGEPLMRLAAGGPAFGHLTLTRFFALHVGCMAGSFFLLFAAHLWLVRRAAAARAETGNGKPAAAEAKSACCRWLALPAFHGAACLGLLVVVLLLVFGGPLAGRTRVPFGWVPGDLFGKELGAPADRDPANFYAAARPEWTFRGLYGFSNAFPGELKVLAIFVIPSILGLLVLLMPVIAYWRPGHLVNLAVFAVLAFGVTGFSIASWAEDWESADHHAALQAGQEEARRVKDLIRGAGGIPPSGALALLRSDPKTQGPKLWRQQCAVCHDYTDPAGVIARTENPSAPDLAGFAGRAWIAGLLDPEKIASPAYFGNTRFAAGIMVRYVQGRLARLKPEDREAIVDALAAEARSILPPSGDGKARLEKGRKLVGEQCGRCHRFGDAGRAPTQRVPGCGDAPDLTGYGSREWILGVVADPTHSSFYGMRNDRMPAYVPAPGVPEENRLLPDQLAVVADWLRGRWYEPGAPRSCSGEAGGTCAEKEVATPVLFALGTWQSRRIMLESPPAKDPAAEALALYKREHCAVCHANSRAKIAPPEPSAPDLGGYATREWLTGLLDPKQVAGPKYFGTSTLSAGKMVQFVKGNLQQTIKEMEAEEKGTGKGSLAKVIEALAKEARRDAREGTTPSTISEETRTAFEDLGCADCHTFHPKDKRKTGTGPDLTGYGSRQWIAAIIADPSQARFYGERNDGMPSYRMFPAEPRKNLLEQRQIELLADWLRGK